MVPMLLLVRNGEEGRVSLIALKCEQAKVFELLEPPEGKQQWHTDLQSNHTRVRVRLAGKTARGVLLTSDEHGFLMPPCLQG